MLNIREKQIYDMVKEVNPNKIKYDESFNKKIVQTIGKWLDIDLSLNQYFDMEHIDIKNCINSLREFLLKPEFFPHVNSNNSSLVYDMERFYFVVSLCESEPKRFKYVIQTSLNTYLKNKFDVLENGRINLNKASGESLNIGSYEEMKKLVCDTKLHEEELEICRPSFILSNFISKKSLKKMNFATFFSQKGNFKINCTDGSFGFSLELLMSWSNTVINWVDCLDGCDELLLPFNKRIVILYILIRLSLNQKSQQNKVNLHGHQFDFETNQEFIENHQLLYKIADYLEDEEMIESIVRKIHDTVKDIYSRQKFLEILNL